MVFFYCFFFSSRRRHTRSTRDWSSDVCSSDLLGWVLCPPTLAAAIADEKAASDRGPPVLDQLAVATLIESGRYDRHLRRMRTTYANRRGALVDALARHAPAAVNRRAGRHRRRQPALRRPLRHEHLPLDPRDHPTTARPRLRQPHRTRHREGHRRRRRPPPGAVTAVDRLP